ncbi:MAG: MATE family efflux transporter [Eubacteriales bacterium]|nr:MATE family efflux transporter [Eubacteriales bacterium]
MTNEIKQENPLGTEKISKLIFIYALPSVVSMVVNSLYNIVDQVFIGQGVGYLGNGATNVILPITVFGCALGLLLGDGGATYLSLQLGRGRREDASRGVAHVIVGQFAIGIIMCVILLVFLKPLCLLFGATENILPYAMDYGRIIALGFPIVVFTSGMSSVIRADGSPRISMVGLLAGCIANVILDALFVLYFQWGVSGAALATIIGQYLNGIIFLVYQWHYKQVKLKKEYFRVRVSVFKKICTLGLSSFITQMATVVIMTITNKLLVYYGGLSKYGADIPITALGVTMKINNLLLSVFMGVATGCQTIISFNYGAGKGKRCLQTFKGAVIVTTVCAAIATFFFQVFPMSIVSIFGSESDLYNEFAVKTLRVFLMLCIFDGFNNVSVSFLQAIAKPVHACASTLIRQLISMLLALLILPLMFGIDGILYSGPVAVTASAIIIFFIAWPQVKNIQGGEEYE